MRRVIGAALCLLALAGCGPSAEEIEQWREPAAHLLQSMQPDEVLIFDRQQTCALVLPLLFAQRPGQASQIPALSSQESALWEQDGRSLVLLPRSGSELSALNELAQGRPLRAWLVRDEHNESVAVRALLQRALVVDRLEFPGGLSVTRLIDPTPEGWRQLLRPETIPDNPLALDGDMVAMFNSPLTFSPAAASEAALAGVLAGLDPALEQIPLGRIERGATGWTRAHAAEDWVAGSARALESLLLARRVSGSGSGLPAEAGLRRGLLGRIMTDGLAYRRDAEFSDVQAVAADQAALLDYLTTWLELDPAGLPMLLISASAQGLLQRCRPTPHGLELSAAAFWPGGAAVDRQDNRPAWADEALLLEPLVHAATLIRDPRLDRLIDGLAGYLLFDSAALDSAQPAEAAGVLRLRLLQGLWLLARRDADLGLQARIEQQAAGALAQATEWGWLGQGDQADSATLADLIELCLLPAAGQPQWYEQAERLARNQLLAAQWPADSDPAVAGLLCEDCSVLCRGARAQAGSRAPAALARLAVSVIGSEGPGRARIDLLLSGCNGDAVVLSELPYRGRITIEARRACAVRLRWPDWATGPRLDGVAQPAAAVVDGYLDLGSIPAGGRRTLEFELPDRLEPVAVRGMQLNALWRGNSLVGLLGAEACEPRLYPALAEDWERDPPRGTVAFFVPAR